MDVFSRAARRVALAALALAAIAGRAPADQFSESGWDDLAARLGLENIPTGAGVVVGQVEILDQGSYVPNPGHPEFPGITFVHRSGTPNGHSPHATFVGRNYYGDDTSLAPGIPEVHNWEVNDWIGNGFLRVGGGNLPPVDIGPVKIINNSWIANAGSGTVNEVIRRLDDAVVDQDLIVVCGMNNGGGNIVYRLLSHQFNGLAVGRKDGSHEAGDTSTGVDGPGRMKPEIVAPRGTTSEATALISAAAALMVETARTWPGLQQNLNADRADVIKAVLLAGAEHRPGWSNNPIDSGSNRGVAGTPLDPVYGADVVDVNRAHLILTGLEHAGSLVVPTAGTAPAAAWDLAFVPPGEEVHYRFEIPETKPEFSAVATWHRRVHDGYAGYDMPNLDLELFRVENDGSLVSLRGAGTDVFASGNIASVSPADNVEHLHLKNLAPGEYVLRLRRPADGGEVWQAAVAWYMPGALAQPAELLDFNVVRGTHVAGSLDDLAESDDSHLRTRSQLGFTAFEPNVAELRVGFATLVDEPAGLAVAVESRINNPEGTARVGLRNWATGQFTQVGSYPIDMNETTVEFFGIDATNFVRPADGRIDTALTHVVIATFSAIGFDSYFDAVDINVN